MLDFPMLGEGGNRRVYDLGNGTVIKTCNVPFYCGRNCGCLREGKYWDSLTQAERQKLRLAPVLSYGPCWVQMPKALVLGKHVDTFWGSEEQRGKAEKILDTVSSAFYAISRRHDIADTHPYNIGLVDDLRWCIIDYECSPLPYLWDND